MSLLRSSAAVLLLGGSILVLHAADLGTPGGVVGQPTYGPPPPLWSGLYLGLHGGYGSAQASGTSFDGLLGGVQVGYNHQFGRNFVVGVEADISGADISRTDPGVLFGIAGSATTRTYAFGTIRGRAGVTFDQFMVYGTGGFAWAVNELSGTLGGVTASDTRSHSGYTFGAGLEWMITPAWTARAEYLYAHFHGRSYFGGTVQSGSIDTNVVRFGVNYLFK